MRTFKAVNRPLVKKIQTDDNGFYIYDARTNRLMRVTPAMYEMLDYFDNLTEQEIENLMSNRYPQKDIEQGLGILKELADTYQLFLPGPLERRAGTICAEAAVASLSTGADMMTIEVTDNCNLRCKYCIFSGGYLHSRAHGRHQIPFSTAKTAIDFYRSTRKHADNLSIGFYGGEPLLSFDVIRQCCDYVHKCEQADGLTRPILFSLTTNGTLLTEERLSFFVQYGFALTISVDGPREIHDECRVFANGKGTFDIVFQNLQNLYRMAPEYYEDKILINCTLPFSADLIALQDFYEKYDQLFGGKLNISEVTEGNDSFVDSHQPYADRARDVTQLEQEYCLTHVAGKAPDREFYRSFVRFLFEHSYLLLHRRSVDDVASNNLNRVNACFPGKRKVFVDVDGRLHMCERVYRQYPIGDVWKGYDIEKVTDVFNQFSTYMNSEECKQCWAVQMCPHCFTVGVGGQYSPKIKQELCSNHKRRMEAVIANYCAILERNPAAFDYMNDFSIS